MQIPPKNPGRTQLPSAEEKNRHNFSGLTQLHCQDLFRSVGSPDAVLNCTAHCAYPWRGLWLDPTGLGLDPSGLEQDSTGLGLESTGLGLDPNELRMDSAGLG